MTTMLDVTWWGGGPGARQRRRRPGLDELPWGPIAGPEERLREARAVWTHAAFLEYASAAAFAALARALLEAAAPIDLVADVADIVVDELDHVETTARLVMALGGAVPVAFDLAEVAPRSQLSPALSDPRSRAVELAIVTSCVGESLSVPTLARARDTADEPLVHAVLRRLLADEPNHARIGFEILDWAAAALSPSQREALAAVAVTALRDHAALWLAPACAACPPPVGLGGLDEATRAELRHAARAKVVEPLVRRGIVLDEGALRAIAV
ncbi:MAG: ferritin-like domain-containing protein [Kofleriaceae bacterium]